MQERRKYVLKHSFRSSYSIQERQGLCFKTITKNISPSGARFTTREALPKDTILDIAIKIPTETKLIKAKIVWSSEKSEPGKKLHDSGCEFIQIPEKSKQVFF